LRTFFFLLVFANLVFFAWGRGYLGGQDGGHEPQRLANQMDADKLRVVVVGEPGGPSLANPATAATTATTAVPVTPVAPAASTAAPVTVAATAATSAPAVAATPVTDAATHAVSAKPSCRLVGGLPATGVGTLKTALAGVGVTVDLRPPAETSTYWVHIPPQAGKEAAEKKAAELRQLGVTDFYIVKDEGPSRWALSLGLFNTEPTASGFLQGLAKRGVKSAKIEVREKSAPAAQAIVKGPADVLDKRLPEALAKLQGATVAPCP